MSHAASDLRSGVRQLARDWRFALTAIATLAVALGVATALFSVIYGAWLNAYPYRDAEEILSPRTLQIGQSTPSADGVFRQREFLEFSRIPVVSDAFATLTDRMNLTGDHPPESVDVMLVSGNTFSALGVLPMLGRSLQPSDVRQNGQPEPVAVLSFNLWRRMFGEARDVVGRSITLDGVTHVVVGVMDARFGWGSDRLPRNDGLWLPLPATAASQNYRVSAWVRLRNAALKDTAAGQFDELFSRLAREPNSSFPQTAFRTTLRSLVDGTGTTATTVNTMRSSLTLLVIAVGFLLFVACTNVSGLQLARSSIRRHDLAIQQAIGASRSRLVRQLLTENVVLAAVAGLLGVILAAGLMEVVVSLIPRGYIPGESSISLNVSVVVSGLALSLCSGLVVGAFPAVRMTGISLWTSLQARVGERKAVLGNRTRSLILVATIAMSLTLVSAAGMAIEQYVRLQRVDLGFTPERLVETNVTYLSPEDDVIRRGRQNRLSELPGRLGSLPAIEAAAVSVQHHTHGGYQVDGEPRHIEKLDVRSVSADYLRVMGVALQRGRDTAITKGFLGDSVAVINSTAMQLWPDGRDPVGTRVALYLKPAPSPPIEVTIVGVIADSLEAFDTRAPLVRRSRAEPTVLIPYRASFDWPAMRPKLFVRTHENYPLRVIRDVRAIAFDLDRDILLSSILDLEEEFAGGRPQIRFNAILLSGLGTAGLILAAAGSYALLSYELAAKKRDIAIRLALGATRSRVGLMVVASCCRTVGTGLVVGTVVTVVIDRVLAIYGLDIPRISPAAILTSAGLLAFAGALAAYGPIRRATRLDPSEVLRTE